MDEGPTNSFGVNTAVIVDISGFLGLSGEPADTIDNAVKMSAVIAAHEIGHTIGFTHSDSFGPIGFGIHVPPGPSEFLPPYGGPIQAFETTMHVISSPASVGSNLFDLVNNPFLGERELIVAAFDQSWSLRTSANPGGNFIDTASSPLAGTPPVMIHEIPDGTSTVTTDVSVAPKVVGDLVGLNVPNTMPRGVDAGKTLDVAAMDVLGHIGLGADGHSQSNFIAFTGRAGDLINLQVLSVGMPRIANQIDPVAKVFGPDGKLMQLGSGYAVDDDDFDGGISNIVDLKLPSYPQYADARGNFTFYVEVHPFTFVNNPNFTDAQRAAFAQDPTKANAVNNTSTGDYELFVYRFLAASPTSGSDNLIGRGGNVTVETSAANIAGIGTTIQASVVNVQASATELAQIITALNNLPAQTNPVTVNVDLTDSSPYSDLVVDLPAGISLNLIGNGLTTIAGPSSALTVNSGAVSVSGFTFTTTGDVPTILVTGGSLSLRNDTVAETTGYHDAAIDVTGGTVDLGTQAHPGQDTLVGGGSGTLIANATANPIPTVGTTFNGLTTSLTVAPSVTLSPAPSTNPVGTALHLSASVDAGPGVDPAYPFAYSWSVTKTYAGLTTANYAIGAATSVAFTPDGVGTYVVSFAATDATREVLSLTTETIMVTPATPQVSVNNVTITYGTSLADSQLVGTATVLVNGTPTHVEGTFTYTTAEGALLGASPLAYSETVTFTPNDAIDYNSITTTVAVAVNKYAIRYTIDNLTQSYGSPLDLASSLGTTIQGINGETLAITYNSFGDSATAHAGSYDLTATLSNGSGLTSDYAVTLTNGTLTVNPFAFTYQIGSDTQTYGSVADLGGDLGSTIATGVNGQNLAITYSSAGDTITAHARSYDLIGRLSNGTGLTSDYNVTLSHGTLTVNPYAFSYQIGSDSQIYGAAVNLAHDLGTTILTPIAGQNLSIAYTSTGANIMAHVGTYAITGTVSDSSTGRATDYVVTVTSGTLTVTPFAFSYTIHNDSQTYGSAANLAGDLPATIAGVNGENLAIAYSSTGDTATAHVGSYDITGTLSSGSGQLSDYSVTLTPGRLTVSALAVTYQIGDDVQTYGTAANLTSDLGATPIAGANGQNLLITYNSTGDTPTAHVGSYPITGLVADGTGMVSDYQVTVLSGTLTVNPYAYSYTVGDDRQTYGKAAILAADLPATINTGINGEKLAITYRSDGASDTAAAGTYAIIGTVGDSTGKATDYVVSLTSGTLTVNQTAISAFNYTLGNDSQVYGTAANLAADLPTTLATGVNGETLTITYSSAGDTGTAHVGTYDITGVLSDGTGQVSNYAGITLINGTLTVKPRALAYQIANVSQTYGTAAVLSATILPTGVNGETLAINTSSTGASAIAHAGSYAITGAVGDGTGKASDYTVTLTNGKLTVNPYAFTYMIGNDSQTYGSAANLAGALGTSIPTGVNGQNLAITYGSSGATATAHVGSYDITGAVGDGTGLASDYTVTFTSGKLTVNAFAFTYAIGNDSQTYGTAANLAHDVGTTIGTGVNGQNLLIAYSSIGATTVADVGAYAITGSLSNGTGTTSDYNVTLTNGTLTVTPFAFNYTIGNDSQTYGTAANLCT